MAYIFIGFLGHATVVIVSGGLCYGENPLGIAAVFRRWPVIVAGCPRTAILLQVLFRKAFESGRDPERALGDFAHSALRVGSALHSRCGC